MTLLTWDDFCAALESKLRDDGLHIRRRRPTEALFEEAEGVTYQLSREADAPIEQTLSVFVPAAAMHVEMLSSWREMILKKFRENA